MPKPGEDDFRGHRARDLAGTVPAHPVGQRDDPEVSVDCDAVFVVLSNVAEVGGGGCFDAFARHVVPYFMRLEHLGRYEISGELGRGAMGVVYRARDPLIDRVVAIKTISVGLSRIEAETFEKRFDHEAKSAGRLNHPNIVTIYDVGKSGDVAYIAMELLEGRSLRDLLDSGVVLPPTTIADIGAQIADGLASAHQSGVIHCDIKPANIVVLPSGLVKITDFGIAMLPTGSRTFTGSIVGSPKYISPEQIVGRKVDARSDVFSLGAVLYEVLTGVPPFAGNALDEILHQVINAKPDPPSTRNRNLAAFDPIVERALNKHPDDRYQTAQQMAADLRQLALVGPRDALGATLPKRPASAKPGDSTILIETPVDDAPIEGESSVQDVSAQSPSAAWRRRPIVRYGVPAALVIVAAVSTLVYAIQSFRQQQAAAKTTASTSATSRSPSRYDAVIGGSGASPAPAAPAVAATAPTTSAEPPTPARTATPEPVATAANPPEPAPAPNPVARVGFAVTPWGEVYINGRKTGVTPPLKEIKLPPGRHTVEIRNTTFKPHTQVVELQADATVRIRHKFE